MASLALARRSFRKATMDRQLSALEVAVLLKLLAGDHPVLRVLRKQVERSGVKSRDFTGAGFMTELDLPMDVTRARLGKEEVRVGGVLAEVSGLSHGAGFVLYLKDGLLDALEGYSYDEPWPEAIASFELRYATEREGELERLQDLALD